MHAHASDEALTEVGSTKFSVRGDGSSRIVHRGKLTEHEASRIQKFIAENYETMYLVWRTMSQNGFYLGEQNSCEHQRDYCSRLNPCFA